jgi:predicted transcriptional regulator
MKAHLQQRLLHLIRTQPGISKTDLALAVGQKVSNLTRPLQGLISEGQIKPGKENTYFPWQPTEPPITIYNPHTVNN